VANTLPRVVFLLNRKISKNWWFPGKYISLPPRDVLVSSVGISLSYRDVLMSSLGISLSHREVLVSSLCISLSHRYVLVSSVCILLSSKDILISSLVLGTVTSTILSIHSNRHICNFKQLKITMIVALIICLVVTCWFYLHRLSWLRANRIFKMFDSKLKT